MNTADFVKYLNAQVKQNCRQYSLNEGKAFGLWYAVDSLSLQEDEALEAVSVDGGNDKDIDFFFLDQEAERVLVAQLKFSSTGKYKAKKDELLSLIHTTDWLRDPISLERDGRSDLAAAAQEYQDAIEKGYSVLYLYVYCGASYKDVVDTARQFNYDESIAVPSRTCSIVDLRSLIAQHSERIDQSTRIEKISIPCDISKSFEENGKFGSAFVTSLDGEQLRDLYIRHGDRLFDRNVRLFLGVKKGSVNAGMRETITSAADRPNFWAYNNGVTFVCDHFEVKAGKLHLTNFSIVNGCQTTVTIGSSTETEAKGIQVLSRFIAAPEKGIDSIIRFTNSQNPIRLWDLNAQDKLQKRLKKEIEDLPQPFLYVLRKGELRQLTAKDRDRFRRGQKGPICAITFDLNAQYLAAFRGLPAVAYKDKGKVFSVYYGNVFPDQVGASEIVLVWQAGQIAAEVVKNELSQAISNEDSERISILKRGAKFFVLACMSVILHERNGKTFLNKLKEEVAVSKTTEARLSNYATIALEWYVESMIEIAETGAEITTIVRSQDSWAKIRSKIQSKWKVYALSKSAMEEALPRL